MGKRTFISNIENSKTAYGEWYEDESKTYPGHESMKIGCLQRIAAATEAMSQNYVRMQNDLAMYKRWYEQEKASVKILTRSNNALRGHLKRLKKTKTKL